VFPGRLRGCGFFERENLSSGSGHITFGRPDRPLPQARRFASARSNLITSARRPWQEGNRSFVQVKRVIVVPCTQRTGVMSGSGHSWFPYNGRLIAPGYFVFAGSITAKISHPADSHTFFAIGHIGHSGLTFKVKFLTSASVEHPRWLPLPLSSEVKLMKGAGRTAVRLDSVESYDTFICLRSTTPMVLRSVRCVRLLQFRNVLNVRTWSVRHCGYDFVGRRSMIHLPAADDERSSDLGVNGE